MTLSSTCPECGSILRHTTELPGSAEVPITASCPSCDYEETITE